LFAIRRHIFLSFFQTASITRICKSLNSHHDDLGKVGEGLGASTETIGASVVEVSVEALGKEELNDKTIMEGAVDNNVDSLLLKKSKLHLFQIHFCLYTSCGRVCNKFILWIE